MKNPAESEQGCDGAPDWVIEIVSSSSRSMDYYKKLFQYRTAGVREYWVVDSDRKIVTVYNFEKDSMEEYLFADNIPAGIYEDFSIKIKVLYLHANMIFLSYTSRLNCCLESGKK